MTDATTSTNGTPTSVSTLAAGKMGAGVTLNGTASYIAMDSGSSLNPGSGSAFTYSVWFNTADTLGGLFTLRSSTNSNPVIDVMVGMDGASSAPGQLMVSAATIPAAGSSTSSRRRRSAQGSGTS